MDIAAIEDKRRKVLEELASIRALRPGSVSEQFLKVPHKGKKDPAVRGPYFLWQYWVEGKARRERLRTAEEVAVARREVAQYKRFVALCKELEALTRHLGELERARGVALEAEKKRPKSSRSRTRRPGG